MLIYHANVLRGESTTTTTTRLVYPVITPTLPDKSKPANSSSVGLRLNLLPPPLSSLKMLTLSAGVLAGVS